MSVDISEKEIDNSLKQNEFDDKRVSLSLFKLSWPILVENVIRVAINSVDVFMLSWYSEKAVAAVGLINQFIFFLMLLYLMISSGAGILISQNIGAKRLKDAGVIGVASLLLSLIFAAILSVLMFFCANPVLNLYKLDPDVHKYALQFFTIYGSTSVFVAVGIVFSTILRSYGYTYLPMIVNIIALLINITGNYISIYGPCGLPVFGVRGVAWSTVTSQAIACVIMMILVKKRNDIQMPFRKIFNIPGKVYKQILSIGVPTAGENMSYNLGQIVIMRMMAVLGTDAMAASVYAMTLLRFVFITSISIGNGTQIKVGYLVGAGRSDLAHRKVYGYFAVGFIISLILVVFTKIAQVPLVQLFTANDAIKSMVYMVLVIALIHEPGRAFNLIIIPALKGAGDVKFPVYVGMIFMWGIGVLFAYILGVSLHWGIVGIWIALAADEWIRGLIMFFRWHTGQWRNKRLICD